VSSKGQVTVPKIVRDALGVKEGDVIVFRVDGDRALLVRTPDFLDLGGTIHVPRGEAKRRLGRRDRSDTRGACAQAPVSAFVDTNVLVRHLTGDPPAMAACASAYLRAELELFLAHLIVAETVYVLESFYVAPRVRVAQVVRSLLALNAIVVVDRDVLLRAVEVYETDRLDFAEAYLVACAESTGVERIASFDRSIDRVTTVERIEPDRPAR